MTTVRYVCLSDLHLGAPDSTLTQLNAAGEFDAAQPSPTLLRFASSLRRTLRHMAQAARAQGLTPSPPTLVLLGDILDLGISPMGQVARVFTQFVEALFPPGQEPVLSPTLLLVPGNHDHHLWRMAQDTLFVDALRRGEIHDDLIDHSEYRDRPPGSEIRCDMLTAILQRHLPDEPQARVHIAYPNLCLLTPDRQRGVVLHHGHYVDPTYRLMSTVNGLMSGQSMGDLSAETLEQENGAWVDFLWSDLGSAGDTGREAFSLYQVMNNAGASHAYADQFRERLLDRVATQLGFSGSMPLYQGITLRQLVGALIELTLTRNAQGQRNNFLDLVAPEDLKNLSAYIAGPALYDLQAALRSDPGAAKALEDFDLSFVYGHTHKPFQQELVIDGLTQPVAVYNTGGWVLDQPTMTFTQGASAVFISDDLHLAALRLFNDPVDGVMAPVRAEGLLNFRDRHNPLLTQLQQAVMSTEADWAGFSVSAREKLEALAAAALQARSMAHPYQKGART